MHIETIDFTVLADYLPAIFNGDVSALDKHDIDCVDELHDWATQSAPEGFVFGHFADSGEAGEWGRCEVSRLSGAVAKLQAVYLPK